MTDDKTTKAYTAAVYQIVLWPTHAAHASTLVWCAAAWFVSPLSWLTCLALVLAGRAAMLGRFRVRAAEDETPDDLSLFNLGIWLAVSHGTYLPFWVALLVLRGVTA